MDVLNLIVAYTLELAKFLGALAVIWPVVNKWIVKPYEKRKLAQQALESEKLNKTIEESNKPIFEMIEELKHSNKYHEERDNTLTDIAKQNEVILKRHEAEITDVTERVYILEQHNGINRKVTYKEIYKGENE